MNDNINRTIHSQEAFQFSDIFGYKFGSVAYGEEPKRKLKIAEPEMSTDGGRKARQPLVLTPEEQSGHALVCGWIDVPKRVAELRSYNVINQQYESRFGSAVDISREEYNRAIGELQSFFKLQKVEAALVEASAQRPPTAAERSEVELPGAGSRIPAGLLILMIAVGLLIGFGVAYLVFGTHPVSSG